MSVPDSAPKVLRVIGTAQVRSDGEDKVRGRAVFGDDFHLKNMLHGGVLRSPHAHARIVSIDTSKAAANHLVRELAIEMAPLVRVNAVAPATVVKGSTMFPRDRVIASLTKYEIPFGDDDSTDDLREKLAAFYARRSLTQTPIEPEDQAEAIFLLLSPRLSKTTGHVIPVDGGLQDGFLR